MSSTFQHLNYYPFGMLMEERSYTATAKGYRFGFNGKEMDDETFDGAIAFEARIYDSRLGRFFSTDPWEHKYAWQSTYSYYKNCPISILDFLGKGGEDVPPNSSVVGLYDFLKKVTKDGQITDEDDIGQVSVSVHAKGYSDFKKWRRRTSRNIKSGFQNISNKASHFLGSADDFMKPGGRGHKAAHDYYDGLVIGGDNFRSNIETIINETTDGNFEPIFNTIYPPIGMQSGDNFEPISLPSNATELGEASFSVIPIVLTKGRNGKYKNGPKFDMLKDHARRHGGLCPNKYYNNAVDHMINSQFTFKVRHNGQNKIVHVSMLKNGNYMFTSRNTSGNRIYTHLDEVTIDYLSNKGIKLPQ